MFFLVILCIGISTRSSFLFLCVVFVTAYNGACFESGLAKTKHHAVCLLAAEKINRVRIKSFECWRYASLRIRLCLLACWTPSLGRNSHRQRTCHVSATDDAT